ncbi:hypothetical protein STENM327S_01903 [Streptomyces tendae]
MDAAFNLGILFAGRGEEAVALRWYERAAAGHTEAALQVGIALLRDGDEAGTSGICGARRGAAARRPRTASRPCSTPGGRRCPRTRSGSRWTRRASARSGTSGRPRRGTAGLRCGWACSRPLG